MKRGLFISATSTGCGKTWVTRGLARACLSRGRSVAALKPIETGCAPAPLDATVLARSCGRPELARAPGLYRATLPLAPRAVTLETGLPAPDLAHLAGIVRTFGEGIDCMLVEGAGGLLAPLDATRTVADLACALDLPLLLVTTDALGVISHVLTAVESARARALHIAAVVLVAQPANRDDPSMRTNRRVLAERLDLPVLAFPTSVDDDDALAGAAARAGLVSLFLE